jgi:hypothetical protein
MSICKLLLVLTTSLSFVYAEAAELPLSVSQVETTIGRSGLATKPAKYDKQSTNFVTADGANIVTLKVASSAVYEVWKAQPAMDDQKMMSGIGEEAVTSKKGHYICFKKSTQGICVVSGAALPGRPAPATYEQVIQLAKLAATK